MGNPADSVEPSVATVLPDGALVLIACSGGADSIALLSAAVRVGVRCSAGHVDHGLRPESAREAEQVQSLARKLGVDFHLARLERLEVRAAGLEAAARDARYAALARLAKEAGASLVATAHTRRDQAETVLLRLLRGAGPGALAGVRRRRPLAPGVDLIRPLLDVTRAATEAYCRERGLAFVDDPHNSDPARTRARLRALWPALLAFNPRLEESLAGAADLFAAEDELLDALARDGAHLHPALQRRALLRDARTAGAAPRRDHVEALLRLLERGEGSLDLPGARASVTFDRRHSSASLADVVAIGGPGRYAWHSRMLDLVDEPGHGVDVDPGEAPFPWTLRTRRPGDRFRPAGGRTKKVADLLIDAHIPREERTRLAVLADASGRLFWVEGLRPGAACRPGAVSFRLHPEMKPPDGPLPSRRRHESRSATVEPAKPDEEPR